MHHQNEHPCMNTKDISGFPVPEYDHLSEFPLGLEERGLSVFDQARSRVNGITSTKKSR